MPDCYEFNRAKKFGRFFPVYLLLAHGLYFAEFKMRFLFILCRSAIDDRAQQIIANTEPQRRHDNENSCIKARGRGVECNPSPKLPLLHRIC